MKSYNVMWQLTCFCIILILAYKKKKEIAVTCLKSCQTNPMIKMLRNKTLVCQPDVAVEQSVSDTFLVLSMHFIES